MGTIETRVDGSSASVKAAAQWLRESLKGALVDAGEDLVSARSHAMSGFQGLAGQAYVDCDKTVLVQVDDHADRVANAATVFEAYAARLQQMKDRMEVFRGAATAGGLTVSGTVIYSPPDAVAPPAIHGPVSPEQQAAYDGGVTEFEKAAGKVALYNQLANDKQHEDVSFIDWVDENLTAVTSVFDVPAVEKLLGVVKDNLANFTTGVSTELGQRALKDISNKLRGKADDLRSTRRSGNPARRALGNAPETPGRIADLLEESKWIGRGGKLLGPAGLLVDGYFALEGDKPGGGLLAVGFGAAATVGVIAYVATAPVSVPATVVVVGAVAVGVGVTYGVNAGWDALPDGVTDPVDDFVGGAWDGGKDLAGDAWEGATGWL